MPSYNVKVYNEESGMLHTEVPGIFAPDEETAKNDALDKVKQDIGYGFSADGGQATASLPRFRVAVIEVN
jgi:hypothetical protein